MTALEFNKSDFKIGKPKVVDYEGEKILVCRTKNGFHALEAICPHRRLVMRGARIRGQMVMCPHHGARFCLDTGESVAPQITKKHLNRYPIIEETETGFKILLQAGK